MNSTENVAVIHIAKYLDGYDRLCDHNCIFCMERMEPGDSNESLPALSKIKLAILQYIAEYGEITKLYIAGGEPTLRKDFFEIVKLAQNYCNSIVLSTCCDYKDAYRTINMICDLGIKSVTTSIHGSTNEIHDSLTGVQGSFDNTLGAIRQLLNNNIKVAINSVVCSININDMPQIALMFSKNKISIDKLTFTHYIHHGNAYYHDELKFNGNEYKKVLSQTINNCDSVPYEITFRDFPLCLEERLAEHQEIVEHINIICLNTKEMIATSEKAPVLFKEKCYQCSLVDKCPKYLMANYTEA